MKKYLLLTIGIAILIAGLVNWGWSFLIWTLASVSGLGLCWSLLVRYSPQSIGVLITGILKLSNRLQDPGPRGTEAHSADWPQWFAAQAGKGWQPGVTTIATRWMASVNPAAPLPDYPRPQLTRPRWLNLNGLWTFNVVARDQTSVCEFPGQILVPFAIESALSGVQRPLLPGEILWYRRSFSLPFEWPSTQRVILHFGAVDWRASVYVNDQFVGSCCP